MQSQNGWTFDMTEGMWYGFYNSAIGTHPVLDIAPKQCVCLRPRQGFQNP